MVHKNALYPEAVESFACIADKCKNTCCAGWNISIDDKTYKKYKNSNHSLFKKNKKELFEKKNSRMSMVLDNNSRCKFLNERGLCSIQDQLGHNYLSDTCKVYPRLGKIIDGTLEVGLTLSCESAAKLILDNTEGINFIRGTYTFPIDIVHSHTTNSENLIQRNFWPIRIFIIEALQSRNLAIEERLAIIGLAIEKLNKANSDNEILDIINTYTNILEKGNFANFLDDLESKETLLKNQINLIRTILSKLSSMYKDNYKIKEPTQWFISDKFNLETYINTYNTKYKPYAKEHHYILENYLVTIFYNQGDLFSNPEELSNAFINMIVKFGLIKNMITCHFISNNSLSIDELCFNIAQYSKMLEHDKSLSKIIILIIKDRGFNSTPALLSISSI